MKYCIVAVFNEGTQVTCAKRVKALQKLVKGKNRIKAGYYHIPLLRLSLSKQNDLQKLTDCLESITCYQMQVATSSTLVNEETVWGERIQRENALSTCQKKIMRVIEKLEIAPVDRTSMQYIPYFHQANCEMQRQAKQWLKESGAVTLCIDHIAILKETSRGYEMIVKKQLEKEPTQYVYMLQCRDGTYYTGWTNHLDERIQAHQKGLGAKYTKSRLPVKLVYYEMYADKKTAMQREYACKQLHRKEKEALIQASKKPK